MLANSSAIVTIWEKNSLIGFGRATSDKTYRAVLWDIIVKPNQQGIGLGKEIDIIANNKIFWGQDRIEFALKEARK